MKKMREMEFKMERHGLVEIGQEVEISERGDAICNYIIEPALAMSGCYRGRERLKSRKGIVKDIRETERGFYVVVEFDE